MLILKIDKSGQPVLLVPIDKTGGTQKNIKLIVLIEHFKHFKVPDYIRLAS